MYNSNNYNFGPPAERNQYAPARNGESNAFNAYVGGTLGGGYGGGFGGGSASFPRGATMSSGLNPDVPRYQPPQRRLGDEEMIRPESSASNATFATQMPSFSTSQAPSRPPPTSRPFNGGMPSYTYGNNRSNDMMNGLGAGIGGMSLGSSTRQSREPPTSRDHVYSNHNGFNGNGGYDAHGSHAGNNGYSISRHDSVVSNKAPSATYLASQIMSGGTEDPFDRSLNRYDTPGKNIVPTLGPARFKDSKMFSIAETGNPDTADTAVTHVSSPQKPQGPPPIPDWLALALRGLCKPTLEEAFDALPLFELCRGVQPSAAGVVRIKDIPYQTTRQEMTAFVGRNAQILRMPEGSPYHAVHIMMERETGKTMDCFVEFSTPTEAGWVVRQFQRRVDSGRPPKVGDRVVEVTFSTQDELMAELFPRAKHVRWNNGQPVVDRTERKYYADKPAAGFQGFLHNEEFVSLGKHAGLSERSPFASKSPCRVYESMITTLQKYPWYAVEHVTIRERRAIYDCTINLIRILMENLRRANSRYSPLEPTPALLQELAVAALTCPGFSEKQKSNIVGLLHQSGFKAIADGQSINVRLGGNHELSSTWPFATLSIQPGTDMELVKFYAGLFRKATETSDSSSLHSRQIAKTSGAKGNPMGDIHINYGKNVHDLSLAEAAKKEFTKIEQLLGRVCKGANGGSGSKPSSTVGGSSSSGSRYSMI
ncbi:hypothetical protein CLAFUW4_01396 [Fulvia fulva]|uniref:Uncharacterized protein n=1 Tax=Passalora fulva TaxID=5499 RepID=A0A9Q8L611_PASFU|nr:uncharacterized protein CLAFUR5_01398 [Fulvia fulva]KAK4635208.1 hypothetical protein CLAFUR4_01397 [Fulvia fulva]KAK4637182.1 hypothetical protein CLAFUR0_01398 [Fulvia fulva]UJO11515.1 hypothetical protein CLAFUR5_01398 [Fulvia fulva]WPV08642.1 hypothetical protein CLAFUW4_01396 [Fulvia fulva]WPV23987.1 hypothetical protein CLAFUW7_01401 [Fulvia fulva]